MRKPPTYGEPAVYTESAQLGNKMTYLPSGTRLMNGYGSPAEPGQAALTEEQRPLPQSRNPNPPRLPSISQLLNDTAPTGATTPAESQTQYTLNDSPPNYRYGSEAGCVPRRLPEPTMMEHSPISPRSTPGSAAFQGRQWQLDHHDPGVSQQRQRSQEEVKGSPEYEQVRDGRRQTWGPAHAPESFRNPPSPQRPTYDRPSVPSLDSLRLSSVGDIYAAMEPSYHQQVPPYSVVQPDTRSRQDQYAVGAYPTTTFAGHQYSRSADYVRHPYQPIFQNHRHFAGHNNGPMFYAAPEHNPRQMGGRSSNDVPKKRPKLPPAFKLETRRWIDQHIWHPYPSKEFQQDLAVRHGLEQKQVDFHFVNERRRYVVTQLERERAMGNHPPPDLEARNQASPTVNASRSPDERYQRRYSGRMGRRGSRFSHGSNGSTSTNVSGGSDGIGHSKSL